MDERHSIVFDVNGETVSVQTEPRRLLADVLRQDLALFATHLGCEHGVCGACTVRVDGAVVRSCLMFAVQVDGQAVQTAEGLSSSGALGLVQQGFAAEHGLQCGFCTPGFLMMVTDLLERIPNPSDAQIRDELSGNICRCTGYVNIVRAVRWAADRLASPANTNALGDDLGET